jgi:hypothetical protein
MLPVRIGAQAKHIGQCLAVRQKIRLFAHRAEQVQGDHTAGCDQARQQCLRLLDGRPAGRGLRSTNAGLDERGGGRLQLRAPR